MSLFQAPLLESRRVIAYDYGFRSKLKLPIPLTQFQGNPRYGDKESHSVCIYSGIIIIMGEFEQNDIFYNT